MPGPYIHMETARLAATRMRSGHATFPAGATETPEQLGELAHKWRNYLALGAIGPDLFFLLPDFKGTIGSVLLRLVDFTLTTWEDFDKEFYSKWEKWAKPVVDGLDVPDILTGGVANELAADMTLVASSLQNLVLGILAQQHDWFTLLGSGVPQGNKESLFFWSDIFHYRKTYTFPQTLFRKAGNDERLKAFALGWMSHCAADITGHPFVNAKCGGPYRLHWQRHHLIENHMDSFVYDDQHGGIEPYGEFDTSALHFRIAFRAARMDDPYNGAINAPAYDYFQGFPDYTGESERFREDLWDLDSEDLPEDLAQLIIDSMREVFPDNGLPIGNAPRILTDQAPFADPDAGGLPSGRPNIKTIQEMFRTQYAFLKYVTTSGYRPPKPMPPDVFNDHSPPPFPGSGTGVDDDPTRGEDGSDDFNIVDLLLALFAWALWLAEAAVWVATVLPGLAADVSTYPARQVLYDNVAVPLWNIYLAARQTLVMSGYLNPKHEEINRGLVEMGISPTGMNRELAAALASPDGNPPAAGLPFDEPSGRATPTATRGADPAFPRTVVRDRYADPVATAFGAGPLQPSEFLSPWRYPDTNNAGERNGWEPPLSHPGPYQQGQDARALLDHDPGSDAARAEFERARTPAETEKICEAHLGHGEHLGDPVDYTVYMIGKLAEDALAADFNLDADRGYGHKCWDWDRHDDQVVHASASPGAKFSIPVPCSIPDGFASLTAPDDANPALHFDPAAGASMRTHYEDNPAPATCRGPNTVETASPEDLHIALIPPAGQRG